MKLTEHASTAHTQPKEAASQCLDAQRHSRTGARRNHLNRRAQKHPNPCKLSSGRPCRLNPNSQHRSLIDTQRRSRLNLLHLRSWYRLAEAIAIHRDHSNQRGRFTRDTNTRPVPAHATHLLHAMLTHWAVRLPRRTTRLRDGTHRRPTRNQQDKQQQRGMTKNSHGCL